MKTTLLLSILAVLTFSNSIAQTTYEAEEGTVAGAMIADNISGFSGSGYVVFEDTGSVTVNVNVETAGSYPLMFGYRSVFDEKIQDLYVNGEFVQKIIFPQSAEFTNIAANPMVLNAGSNTIEIRKSFGFMDLDYFEVGTKLGSNNYEAEDGTVIDANISDEGTGFKGSGYVVFKDTGSVAVMVNVLAAGDYPLEIGFRSAFGDKKQDVYVNGILIKDFLFPESLDFTSVDAGIIPLNSGENTIEIRKNFGFMDIDYFFVGELVDSDINEAENGTITDAVISNAGDGFSGTGYVVFKEVGSVAVTTDVAIAGAYSLTLGYRSPFGEKRQSLYINDSLVENIVFPESDVFTSLDVDAISLNAGENTIEIRANFGFMDLDYFSVGPFKVPGAIEAEEGTVVDANIEDVVTGFSGNGYVVYKATGSVTVEVVREILGTYALTFGYRSAFGEKRQDLYINGSFAGQVTFPQSEFFTTLDFGMVMLMAGTNTIELRKNFGFMDLDYFLVGDESSPTPIAVAGFQQVKMDVNGNGKETFRLDGSGSSDPNDDIVSYTWYCENGEIAGKKANIKYKMGIGGHELTLEVRDAEGNIDIDTVKLFVGDPTNGGNNRIGVADNAQRIFSSGINLAWDKFSSDIVDLDAGYFEAVLDDIQASGGNSLRWWLHTNGANSPKFDAAGNVTGIDANTIPNMRSVLDLAYARGIVISMCLWSFDMLVPQGQDINVMKAMLESQEKTQTYIDNALVPILEALGDHPAVLTWEIFNEPENMTEEFGFTDLRTSMAAVQQFTNLTAGAIHKTVPKALVSVGTGNFESMTDIEGHTNYYRDDRLLAAGGDALGTLDFYQVHYYPDNFTIDISPFHRPADWWQLDKPIVVGEFPARAIDEDEAPSYTMTEAYRLAYEYGYAGAMAWNYLGFDGGSFETVKPATAYLAQEYPQDININVNADLINDPPKAIATIPNLNLLLEAAESIEDYVSLDSLFYDTEDLIDLEYSVSNTTNAAVATAEITSDNTLNVLIEEGQVGKSILTVRAKDSEGASAAISFTINIREANGNLALFKPIVASTSENDDRNQTFANDGDMESRWSSVYEDNQWIYVDLKEPTAIASVTLFWETAFGKGYEIQVSDDVSNWQTVFTETNSNGGEDIIEFEDVVTRYVRMFGTERNTVFGFSLYEFEVYGAEVEESEAIVMQGARIYPNPIKNNDLKIQVEDENPVSIELIDVFGRTIERFDLQGQTNYSIDTADLAPGLALVKISGLNWKTTEKVLKN